MSSNNNPQATPQQPAEETAAPTAPAHAESASAAPASATLVTIEGQQFELKNLNEEEGARLYTALPAEYQQIANQYATIAKAFDRIAEVQLPSGISLANGFENLKQAYLRGGGALPSDAEPYLQQMDQQLQNMPGYAEAMGAIRSARSAGDVIAAAGSGAAAVIAMPARALNFFNTVWTEIDGAVTRDVSDEQALAFGSAYAAALYKQGADRQNMSTTQLIFSNPVASLSAGIAGLPVVGPYIATFFRWAYSNITSAFSANGGPALTWDQAYAEVTQELEANPNFRDRVNAQARSGDVAAAGNTMTAAQNVAGIATAPIVDAVTNDRTIINSDGQLAQVTTENGIPTIETDTTLNNGAPQGRGDRILDAAINIGGEPARNIANGTYSGEQVLGAAAGGGLALGAVHKVTPGGLRAIPGHGANAIRGAAGVFTNTARGAAAGYLQGTADTFSAMDERNIRTNSFAQSHNQVNQLDRLRIQQTAANAQLDELLGKDARTSRLGQWSDNRNITRAETRLNTVTQRITDLEQAMGKGPQLGNSRLATGALRTSDLATDVMGVANASRLGTLARGAGRLAGRAAPVLTPVFFGVDIYNGVQESRAGNDRAARQSFASAGTVAAGAAVGAGIGVWFFGVGAIPGAAIGAGVAGAADTIGGFFGYGSKDIAGRNYDANVRPTQPTTAAPQRLTLNQAYAQAVRDFDTNGSGGLSNQEIEAVLASVGYTHRNQVDTNQDGIYSKGEFLSAIGYMNPPAASTHAPRATPAPQVAAVGNNEVSPEMVAAMQEELVRLRMAVNRTQTGGAQVPVNGGGQRPQVIRLNV